MSGRRSFSRNGRKDAAVVRVTVKRVEPPDTCEYSVFVEPLRCPESSSRSLPKRQGCLSEGVIQHLESTFPTRLAEVVGIPDQEVLAQADKVVRDHTSALTDVFWGVSVWGTGENVLGTVDIAMKSWWEQLSRDVGFLIVELVLDPKLQKYVWESVLTISSLTLAKTAIVRIRAEDLDKHLSHRPAKNTARVTLLSAQATDLPRLQEAAQSRVDYLVEQGWEQVKASGPRGELDELQKVLDHKEKLKIKALTLVFLGHGRPGSDWPELKLDDGRAREDWVISPRFCSTFAGFGWVTLFLVACSAGFGERVSAWLDTATVVVAMQFVLSEDAAVRFINGLFGSNSSPSDLVSLTGVCHQVASARKLLSNGAYSHIEAATPVIYSRVPVLERRIGCLVALPTLSIDIRFRIVVLAILFVVLFPATVAYFAYPTAETWFSGIVARPSVTHVFSPTTLSVARPLVKINSIAYERPYVNAIEYGANAGKTMRIEILLVDEAGQLVPPGLASYDWRLLPADPLNAKRAGTLNNVLNYTVPTDGRRGQLINVAVSAGDYRTTIVIQLDIK